MSRIIQRDTKLNRQGVPLLDPPHRLPKARDEREEQLRETEKYWAGIVEGQRARQEAYKPTTKKKETH